MKKYLFLAGLLTFCAPVLGMEQQKKRVKQTPTDKLFSAVRAGRITKDFQELVQDLGVNVRNDDGDMPLMQAVYCEQLQMVKWLLEHRANVNAQDTYGNTALHIALRLGPVEEITQGVIKLLLVHGAHIDIKNNEDPENEECGTHGRTPLHYAIECEEYDTVVDMVKCASLFHVDASGLNLNILQHPLHDNLGPVTHAELLRIMASLYKKSDDDHAKFRIYLARLVGSCAKGRVRLFQSLFDSRDMHGATVWSLLNASDCDEMTVFYSYNHMMRLIAPKLTCQLLEYFKMRNAH